MARPSQIRGKRRQPRRKKILKMSFPANLPLRMVAIFLA
jgi:hypothetical protein